MRLVRVEQNRGLSHPMATWRTFRWRRLGVVPWKTIGNDGYSTNRGMLTESNTVSSDKDKLSSRVAWPVHLG